MKFLQMLGKLEIEVSLAKPPTENKKKEQRKNMQNRMMMGGPNFGYGFVHFTTLSHFCRTCFSSVRLRRPVFHQSFSLQFMSTLAFKSI